MSKSDFPSQSENMKKLATYVPDGAGILVQEAAGQQEVLSMDVLPKMLRQDSEKIDAEPAYVQLGIQVLGEADDLFYRVKLPAGWRKEPMERELGSKLLDEKGRARLIIFYKAAYYDRKAWAWLVCRYTYDTPFDEARNDFEDFVVISDGGQEIHRITVETPAGKSSTSDHQQAAAAWLSERYPNWQDPFDYWND